MRYQLPNLGLVEVITGTQYSKTDYLVFFINTFASIPDVALGIIGHDVSNPTQPSLDFLANIGSFATDSFVIDVYINNGMGINYLRISYFAKDTAIGFAYVSYTSYMRTYY